MNGSEKMGDKTWPLRKCVLLLNAKSKFILFLSLSVILTAASTSSSTNTNTNPNTKTNTNPTTSPEVVSVSSNQDRPWLDGEPTALPFLSKSRVSRDTDIYNFGLSSKTSIQPSSSSLTLTLGIDVCSCILVSPPHNRTLIRPYTPVSSRHQRGSFSLLVKKYPNGAMGREFKKLKKGDSMVFWQIPFNEKIQYPFHYPKTILMLAAGTGITPMYQALNRMFGMEEEKVGVDEDNDKKKVKNTDTKVILLYGSRTKKDIYLKHEMEDMKKRYPDRLDIIHVLSEDTVHKSNTNGDSDSDVLEGRIDKNMIQSICNNNSKDGVQVWVCGPPSFYESLCGPRNEKNVSGALKELGYRSNQVIKF